MEEKNGAKTVNDSLQFNEVEEFFEDAGQGDASDAEQLNESYEFDNKSSSNEEKKEDINQKTDYAAIAAEDRLALINEFPELKGIKDITELDNPLRYAALRDLGLTPAEAYLATSKRQRPRDNRSHLYSSPVMASSPYGAISESMMEEAREIFSDISDAEIRKLYKKVTK